MEISPAGTRIDPLIRVSFHGENRQVLRPASNGRGKIRGKATCTVMSGSETGETAETGMCEGKTDI